MTKLKGEFPKYFKTTNISMCKFLQKVSKRKQRLTFGYIRRMQKKLGIIRIPMLVKYHCLAFSPDVDYFMRHKPNDTPRYITLSNNYQTIQTRGKMNRIKCRSNAVEIKWINFIGNECIDHRSNIIATWKLKVNACKPCNRNHGIRIGLRNDRDDECIRIYGSGRYIKSQYFNLNIDETHHKIVKCAKFKSGDIIIFELNLNKNRLDYGVGRKHKKTLTKIKDMPLMIKRFVYADENVKHYRFCVGISECCSASVTLLEFNRQYIQ